jgi:hypothetical protein
MKNQNLFLGWLTVMLTFPMLLSAQSDDCNIPAAFDYLHANDIRASIFNGGSMFFKEEGDAGFNVPYQTFPETPATIFITSLWMGGLDPAGNLKLSAETYGVFNGNTPFSPGPLDPVTGMTTFSDCKDWDRIFTVKGYELLAHLDDWNDNGQIDNPISSLLIWPGKDNPHFEDLTGVALPNNLQGLAPFFDLNSDGVYDPLDGDYPLPQGVEAIPEQISWWVFNDNGNELNSIDPLKVEVQVTAWGFSCTDNELLDQTIFTSHKLISRNEEPLDSVYLSMFTDFDLGCYTDDYLGSNPSANSYFVYNQDDEDGDIGSACPGGVNTYAEEPPVQSVTFLNQELSSFMYFNNASVGNPPPATSDPTAAPEFYNLMNGHWIDGQPLTEGGDGYDPFGVPTSFAFPGDPNDVDSWSMINEGLPGNADQRAVGSIDVGLFQPGQIFTIDMAWSFHRQAGNDHLANVALMYSEVSEIQDQYDQGFSGLCTPLSAACVSDCVWPGDLNADGIANYCDLLALKPGLGADGTTRGGPLNWAPRSSDNWAESLPSSVNYKHIDADGNGLINAFDLALTENHYGLTTPWFDAPVDEFQVGPEIIGVPALFTDTFEDIENGQSVYLEIQLTEDIPDLAGFAFQLEIDTNYFESISFFPGLSCMVNDCLPFSNPEGFYPDSDQLDYAVIVEDPSLSLPAGDYFLLRLDAKEAYPNPLPSDSTQLVIKNIKAIDSDGSEIEIGATYPTFTFEGVTVISSTKEAQASPFQMIPNPASESVLLQFGQEMERSWTLMDVRGQLLYSGQCDVCLSTMVPLGDLPSGMYFVQVLEQGKIRTEKLIIER